MKYFGEFEFWMLSVGLQHKTVFAIWLQRNPYSVRETQCNCLSFKHCHLEQSGKKKQQN